MKPIRTRPYIYAILVALLLFGCWVRLLHIGDQSLWADEAFTYAVIRADSFWTVLNRDVHPPLYFLLIDTWAGLAGISEFSLRLPSLFAGVINLALVYVLTREVMRHRPRPMAAITPVIAVLLLALSDLEIMLAQEARSYTLHLVWVQLSIIAYLRWIRTSARLWALGFVLSTTLIVYTHYMGVFTPFALGLHALIFLRGTQRWQAWAMLILSALLVVPWGVGVVIPQQIGKFASDIIPAYESSWETLWYFRLAWLTDQWALGLLLLLAGIVVIVDRGGDDRIRWSPLRATGLLVLWIVVPLVLAFVVNLWLPVLFDYRISQITPAVVLLIAFGIINFRPRARWLLVLAIVLYSVSIVDVYRTKPPWRELATLTTDYALAGDAVAVEMMNDYLMEYYFDRQLADGINEAYLWQWRTFDPATYEAGSLDFMATNPVIWLTHWSSNDDAFARLAATGHHLTMRRSIDHVGNALTVERYQYVETIAPLLTPFENGMYLVDVNVARDQVDLLWHSDSSLDVDYTVSTKLLRAGEVVAQVDHAPQFNTRPTSTWQSDELIYDPYQFDVSSLPAGRYDIFVQVYVWSPQGITVIPTTSGAEGLIVGQFST